MKNTIPTIKIIIVIISIAFISNTSFAQFYPAKVYSIRDGLPTNTIYDITQGTDGIMWFATSKGVVNYNSLHWQLFSDSLELPNSSFSFIESLNDGSIWIAGQNNQSFVIKYFLADEWHAVNLDNDIEIREKFSFDVIKNDGDGYKIILCNKYDAYLLNTSEKGYKEINLSNDSSCRINAVTFKKGKIYFSTSKGLLTYSDSLEEHPLNAFLGADKEILQIHLKEDAIYLLGRNWLGLYENNKFIYLNENTGVDEISRFNKHNLTVDQSGRIFYSSMSSAQYLDKQTGKAEILYINGRVFNAQSNVIFVDDENNVWVGDHRGLFKFNVLRFQNYNENIGLVNDEVTVIHPYNDQLILANETHLNFLKEGKIDKKISLKKLPGTRILDMATTDNDELFIAAYRAGLKKYDGENVYDVNWKASSDDLLVSSVEYFDKKLFFTTNHALYSYKYGEISKEVIVPNVRNLQKIGNDTIAVLSVYGGLFLYNVNTKETVQYTSDFRNYNSVYDICKWNGRYFIATSGGLAFLENNKIVPFYITEKMNRVSVYSLFVSKNNKLWMGTNEGIFIWDGKILQNYNRAHGLVGDEINRNAFLQLNEKQMWIGTEMGASVYNLDEESSFQLIPNLKLQKVSTLKGTILSKENNELKYHDNTLEFSFLGISYFDENQVKYRYKLIGFDADWIYIKNPNANSVRYTNLPPGEYEFMVESSLENNNWSSPQSINFTVNKPFYFTHWFVILLITIILLLLYIFYRVRFHFILINQRNLKKEVALRTLEIQRMNDEIQAQNEELRSQSEDIASINERLEEIVHDRTKKLREQNEKLSKYAFMNSHELRGPICRMIGLLNLLKICRKDEFDKIIQLIHETGLELDNVTRSINKTLDNVDFSKMLEANSIETINAGLKGVKDDENKAL
ncbi:hypothetical protein GCM10011506_25200 [Marivirga lumbricoides]|uniref:Two component regulator three Y domain-containing protein n=1 Tax=Marivirga lumbricoides TaxID=1046115 RepID=A0ABQ1MF90_9BACT|nr:hypothetical protein GCM10011506_25200 [Marivirga lumbricoides]